MVGLILFVVTSVSLGIGLAMDAFSVTIANTMQKPNMSRKELLLTAGVFAMFQFAMPMIGWICVHTIVETFKSVEVFIPWIAFILLAFIGGKMILDKDSEEGEGGSGNLIVQGIATSIDALSVGFTIASYNLVKALICGLIIGAVTMVICLIGGVIGKKLGARFNRQATIIGGIILIAIGLEILLTGILG